MISIVRNPALFYETTASDRLLGSVSTVFAAAVSNVLGAVILVTASWTTIVAAGTYVTTTYVLSIFFGIGGILGSWILYSAIFHGISALFGGEGSFRKTLIYTGWGFVPIACSGLVRAGLILLRVRGTTFPDAAQQLGPFVKNLTSGPLFTIVSFLGIIFTIWSVEIWIFAIHEARKVSLRDAAITVALPTGLWITWRLYSILSSLF
ncbi:hypothetical protein BRC83_08510 [Halobacteriales archaeon QS_1_68_17]|nr:MAG: hypothetical protein BRC83_08510 [Halobacteriales archaeon QS_1_68_17]